MLETTQTPKSTTADWRYRMKWRLVSYRVDLAPGKYKAKPRMVDVLAPFMDDAHIGVGAAPDENVRKTTTSLFGRLNSSRKTNHEELTDFLESMGSAIQSGASEADALGLAASSSQTPRMRGVVSALYSMVNNGVGLADAMSLFSGTFSPMVVALARAAESGSNKGAVFSKLAERMRNENKLVRKFIGMMIYPLSVLCAAVVVSLILQLKALPPMVETFKEMGAKLPAVTQMFYDVSTFMIGNWYILLPALVIGLTLFITNAGRMYRTPFAQRAVLHLPLFGEIVRGLCMSRALYAYCMLKSNGATDLEIYTLTGDAAGNLVYKEFFNAVYKHISGGVPAEDAYLRERHRIGKEGLWIASKLRVGAFSGDTVPLLQKAADELQDRTESRLVILPQALELPLLALCGVIVGSIILAIFLPYPSLIIDVLQKANRQ